MGGRVFHYEEGFKFEGTRLTFIKEIDPWTHNGFSQRRALFSCECGEEVEVLITAVKNRRHRSCGCLTRDSNSTHGLTKAHGFSSYQDMVRRCYDLNSEKYPDYGGRGIIVCDRWLEPDGRGVSNFFEDMGVRPKGHTLDRTNVNGNYEPENCRWAPMWLQAYNKRIYKTNTSGRCGVSYDKKAKRYIASINFKGVRYRLGKFINFEEAVKAREDAELKYYGYIKE